MEMENTTKHHGVLFINTIKHHGVLLTCRMLFTYNERMSTYGNIVMSRAAYHYLVQWLQSVDRKPIIIRGARQVGKTWLVRELAKQQNKQLIELNFEQRPQDQSYFSSNDPKVIIKLLSAGLQRTIDSENSILFLDEIQAAPILLSKLRWFAEEMPEFPVITAGSLLDFVLDKHEFSMPVGRISYLHLEPLSFEEFLDAQGKQLLIEFLVNYQWQDTIPLAIHQQLMDLFKEYLIIGGMPAAAYSWSKEASIEKISQIHHNLLASYRDDFAKYSGKISIQLLDDVMTAVPGILSDKFVYTRVSKDITASTVKSALNLLCQARVAHKIVATAGNGLPLAAEKNEKFFKVIFLDVGLVSALLGLRLDQIYSFADVNFINAGGLSEQVVGQLLRKNYPFYIDPKLFYWIREQKNSNAEVDYLMQHGPNIIPVEVKSGSTGSLKSLHLFMGLKNYSMAVRINSDLPSLTSINTIVSDKQPVSYQLASIPFYLLEQIQRLLVM